MESGSASRAGDFFPDYEEEAGRCVRFLTDFKVIGDAELIGQAEQDQSEERKYVDLLQKVANRQEKSVVINLDDVYQFDSALAEHVVQNTRRYVSLFEDAVDAVIPEPTVSFPNADVSDVLLQHRRQLAQSSSSDIPREPENSFPKQLLRRFEIRFQPRREQKEVPMRDIRSRDIGTLVKLKGMVSRISDVRPLVTVATYICDDCGNEIYQTVDSKQFMPLQECPSEQCRQNKVKGRLHMQTRGSKMVRFQELKLQELPEQVPIGNVPRSMTVHVRGELTRRCTAGNQVEIAGVFLPTPYTGFKALRAGLTTDAYLHALAINQLKQSYTDIVIDSDDAERIEEIASEPNALLKLYRSIAPEIFGLDDVKEALLLLLVGGVTKTRSDGMRIRGDLNILLMGDPGVAKSQLLKHISTVAPRCVYTTGKGSSGVGLTAAVIRDAVSGETCLEGGALVLADNGICCIDEFDKMEDGDRTAIHEVMEQQTVSIAKAGITTTLNARTSILAAANPLFGRYKPEMSAERNINLQPALLSRFDLIFVLRDVPDRDNDLKLAQHILHVHQHMKEPETEFEPVSVNLFRSYIAKAKTFEPTVPEDLTNFIMEAYVQMRKDGADDDKEELPCTPRTLLSILRLSQALARLRFSHEVIYTDVEEAIRIMHESKRTARRGRNEQFTLRDYQTAIWGIIHLATQQHDTKTLKKVALLEQIRRKGYSEEQFQTTINEYEQLNLIQCTRNSVTVL